MLDLCIDTSLGTSVAICKDGVVLGQGYEEDPRRHAESLAPLIEKVIAKAGVQPTWDRVLVGTGPAPFTGLRAGLITATVVARASGAALHGAPSLELLAAGARNLDTLDELVTVVADAKRGEVYWATYRLGTEIEQVTSMQVGKDFVVQGRQVGPGVIVDPAFLPVVVDQYLAQGRATPTVPLYLREPDVHPGSKK